MGSDMTVRVNDSECRTALNPSAAPLPATDTPKQHEKSCLTSP